MKIKNKGGRPRVALTEKKKYKLPPVRLDTKNYVIVKNLARRAGLPLTEYQRQMVLHGRVVERLCSERILQECKGLQPFLHVNLIKKI